jgi:hypothetical protein
MEKCSMCELHHVTADNKNWEEKLEQMFQDWIHGTSQVTQKEIKSFIRQLLEKERHDNEILVNTILETIKTWVK